MAAARNGSKSMEGSERLVSSLQKIRRSEDREHCRPASLVLHDVDAPTEAPDVFPQNGDVQSS